MSDNPEPRQYRWMAGVHVGLRTGLPAERHAAAPDLSQYAVAPTGWGQAAFDVLCLQCQARDWDSREVAGWITDGGETVTLAEVMGTIQAHHDTHHREDVTA